jgi:hypothetical protein
MEVRHQKKDELWLRQHNKTILVDARSLFLAQLKVIQGSDIHSYCLRNRVIEMGTKIEI